MTDPVLSALLGALDTGVLALDPDRRVTHTNQAFIAQVGLGVRPELLRGTVLRAGPAEYAHAYVDPAAVRTHTERALRSGRTDTGYRTTLADGRQVLLDYTPLTQDGQTIGHLWLTRSATGAAPPGTTPADRTAPTGSQPITNFATALAHEVRTPATSIAAFAAMLDDSDLDPVGRHRVAAAIGRNTERMLALAADLVLLADLEAGSGPPGDQPVDVPALIGRACAELIQPGVSLATEVPSGPALTGDPALIHQALAAALAVGAALAADSAHSADSAPAGPDTAPTDPDSSPADPAADPEIVVRVQAEPDPFGWRIVVVAPVGAPVTSTHLLAARVPHPGDPDGYRTAALALLLAQAILVRHGGGLAAASTAEHFTTTLRLAGPARPA